MKGLSMRFIHFSLLMILLIGLTACSVTRPANAEEIDWQKAIEILHSGQVTEIMQTHNLEVTLALAGGSQIKTIEPAIDEIFREVERCGGKCSQILLITE
jgi:hypothetical protein